MFDFGFLELLVIGVVGLLVLGPERLPTAARSVGLWIGKIKRTVAGMQREINAQLEAEELRQKLSEQEKKLNAGLDKARRDVEGYVESPQPADKSDKPAVPTGSVTSDGPGRTDETGKPGEQYSQAAAEHAPVNPSTSPTDATSAADKDSTPR